MKKLLLGILSFLILNASYAQQSNQTIVTGGVTRNYIQYLPVGFNPSTESCAIVFVLHGLGGTAASMTAAGFNYVADTARVIAVYPQALNNGFGQAAWNNGTLLSSTANDVQLMNDLLDMYISDFNVDPTSVYFTGLSMGSIMSFHLACEMNDRIAAIATMSGTMSTDDIANCNPSYKTPVIHFHGTADEVVPYDENPLPSLSLVPETMAFWQNVHGCEMTTDSIRIDDTAADNLTVDQFIYNDCDNVDPLELWRINGGTHTYFYQPLNDFTEGLEAWWFMRKWHHPAPATVGIDNLNTDYISVYPNPTKGILTINGINDQVEIYSISGEKIGDFDLSVNKNIDLSHVTSGIYFVNAVGLTQPIKVVVNN